ncbi:MAG TPA: hypothetical protein VIA45_06465 [Thermoanaerobaculia bacterium]
MPPTHDAAFALLRDPRVREEPAETTARRIDRLLRAAARDPDLLLRLHDRLLFLLAYPPSERVRRRAERALAAIPGVVAKLTGRGVDLSPFDEPEVAGVAGTTIATDFSFDLARWLAARHPGRVAIEWGVPRADERMRATWPSFVPLLEEEALADANVPYDAWLEAAAGRPEPRAAWLLDRYDRLPFSPPERAERWDALGVSVAWNLASSRASRTFMRRPGPPRFLHREPLLTRRDVSLARVFESPRLSIRRLSRKEGRRVCDMVREATAARYREFYTFTYADPSSVLAARPGRGVEIFLMGVAPERRLPLRSAYGGFVVKNGVPVGYIEGLAFFERLEIGFNLYYAFREGESAWIYAQVMKLHRDALGVTSFSIDPYQLGFENDEAIASGAFWFYRKLGFRPTDPGVARLVAREEERLSADPSYRTPERLLRRLVSHNLLYEVPGTASGAWDRFHVRNLGLEVNRRMARGFGGSAGAIRAAAARRVAKALDVRPAALSPLERRAFESFALVLDEVPDLPRWTRSERRAVVEILRKKAGGAESRYLRLLQRHPRLRAALIALGSPKGRRVRRS